MCEFIWQGHNQKHGYMHPHYLCEPLNCSIVDVSQVLMEGDGDNAGRRAYRDDHHNIFLIPIPTFVQKLGKAHCMHGDRRDAFDSHCMVYKPMHDAHKHA